MIEPTECDYGRAVVYRDSSGGAPEEGVLVRIAPVAGGVYVRFGGEGWSKLCACENLTWGTSSDSSEGRVVE